MPTLSAGPATAVIDVDDGCRLASLSFVEGLELIGGDDEAPADSPFHHGAFPMAPWAGRIRRGRFTFDGRAYELPINFEGHAIHGTVCDRAWIGHRRPPARVALRSRRPVAVPAGTPLQRAELHPDRLRLELEVHAEDATDAGHDRLASVVPPRASVARRRRSSSAPSASTARTTRASPTASSSGPTPAPPVRSTTASRASVGTPTITWSGVGRLEVESDASHLVVYTAPASAVCVEPQTGPPDAPNLGRATVVEPGRPLTAWMELRWRPAPSGTA